MIANKKLIITTNFAENQFTIPFELANRKLGTVNHSIDNDR